MSNLLTFCWRCGKKQDTRDQKFCVTEGKINKKTKI